MIRGWAAAVAVVALAAALPAATVTADASEGCEWLAGDLHIHTTYSHDAWGGPGDDSTGPDQAHTLGFPVTGQFFVAASRGLDYLAITDHNDIRSQSDEGFGAFGVIPVPGEEASLRGHAQMLGATELYDRGDRSAEAVQAMADALRADGGVFQINHPSEGSTDHPHDLDWGYGWEIVPDTVEVWNINRIYQPPFPSASSNDDAVRFWEAFLDEGHRIAATGGSDSHWVSTHAVQGAGQPTTWVCAPERSADGVLEGLRAGHTFITHQPPRYQGPHIFLEADSDGDGSFDAIVGDAVPPGSDLRVRVEGAPGSLLRVVVDGGNEAFEPIPVTSPGFEHRFTAPDATWVRAEIFEPDGRAQREELCDEDFGSQTTYCRNQLFVLAMTSALYQRVEQAATVLVYDGDTSARPGDRATLSATLTDSGGGALAHEAVTFSFRDEEHAAVTDEEGRAAAEVRITGPPGVYEVVVRYEGSDDHLPSTTRSPFVVEAGRP